jgi:pimeloyl-ACP methyl ester carboxylesterase
MKLKIKNLFGDDLDMLIEGSNKSKEVIVFVHGYGTDKNEGFSSFLDLSNYLKSNYLTIRFDLSGYGLSGGKEEEFQFQKAAGDVDSIIRFARKKYPNKKVNIIAHSLGTFIVTLLSPYEIHKTVFTSIPNSDPKFVLSQLQKRIINNGGKINEKGITYYPRTSGVIQKIGKDFWKTYRNFNMLEYLEDFARKTDLVIFKPKQDEVLEYKHFDEYKRISNLKYIEVDGDHNFKKQQDRNLLFRKIKFFLDK